VAEAAAERFGASILSVDSMQVFRGMDIGTAKPSAEVQSRIDHHLIDVADPADEFTVVDFQAQGRAVLRAAKQSGQRVIIVGGSGLHFRSLVDPMTFAPKDAEIRSGLERMTPDQLQAILLEIDPASPEVIDMHNSRRVIRAIEIWQISAVTPSERANSDESVAVRSYKPLVDHMSIGLDSGRESGERVAARFQAMLNDGLLDEVTSLAPRIGRTAAQALGYKELLRVVAGTKDIATASAEAVSATRALVKRQRTFFRRDPRIEWIPWQDERHERIRCAVSRVGEVAGWTS
jgi:tRNA dimethylallyltransferase